MKKILLVALLYNLSISFYGQNSINSKIEIWQPSSFCNIPETINIDYRISCKECSWDYIDCAKLDKKKLKSVIITFNSKKDSTFNFTTKFENIYLISKESGKKIHPCSILMADKEVLIDEDNIQFVQAYMTNKFKANKYVLAFDLDKDYNLILLFDAANVGDTIIVENFIQNEIK